MYHDKDMLLINIFHVCMSCAGSHVIEKLLMYWISCVWSGVVGGGGGVNEV